MKKYGILAAALALCMGLTACGGGTAAPTESPTESQPSEDSNTRTIVVGTVGGSGRYSVLNDDGTWSGVDGDLWNEIQERTGWDIEVKQVEFSGTWGELDAGRIDIASNYWAINDTRKEKYAVSIPYASDVQIVAVPGDRTDINTFEDLRGAKIAVTQGQSAQYLLEEIADQYDFEVVVYESNATEDMLLGRTDALGSSITDVTDYCNTHDVEMHVLDDQLSQVNVGLYAAKTEEGEALIEELNEVLQEMLDDGTIAAITEKWLGMDMTATIVEE